ncbi:signal peptidase I [Patescibacteria group bacterium]|nr:signal peptidase I [Patescibacteria group bacterium]
MSSPSSLPVPETTDSPRARIARFFLELVQVLAISLVIIIPIRYFLIQPFYVRGASMEPNFFDHEYLIIDEISYRFREPTRGEIVVFKYPVDPSQYFIKRVIGIPGDTVEIASGKIKIYNTEHPNGVALDETAYLDQDNTTPDRTVTLKENQYFLMGDNRAASLDSRIFGAVDRTYLVGRVAVRGYPIDRWKLFEAPHYSNL